MNAKYDVCMLSKIDGIAKILFHRLVVCMYVCMYGWMDGWMDTRMYVCMYLCMDGIYLFMEINLYVYMLVVLVVCKYVNGIYAINEVECISIGNQNQYTCLWEISRALFHWTIRGIGSFFWRRTRS